MGEIKDMEREKREVVEEKLDAGGDPHELALEGNREWAEARDVDVKELEELMKEKSIPMVMTIAVGTPPAISLCAMGMYGFELGFEVAAKRYLSGMPEGVSMPLTFTEEELLLIHRAMLQVEDSDVFTADESKKISNIRMVCQGYVENGD